MIEIDGSYLEGGGQIVRTALGLSALTQKAFRISNIRKNRPSPGLKNQHLHAVKILAKMCNASVDGAHLGSETLEFIPRGLKGKMIDMDLKTAGSLTLVLQSVLVPAMFAGKKSSFTLAGGTDVPFSPGIDYFANVYLPYLSQLADIKLRILSRGYYPKGGGKISLTVTPKASLDDFSGFDALHNHLLADFPKIAPFREELWHVKGIIHASSDLMNANVALRMSQAVSTHINASIAHSYSASPSTGCGITLWAIMARRSPKNLSSILGTSVLGKKGISSENVGKQAVENLQNAINSDATVDVHLADQLIPLMALVGKSSIITEEISNHALTNIYTTEAFLGNLFTIDGRKISCSL